MDSIGSLVDTNLRIFPSKILIDYIKTLPIDDSVPINIARLVKGKTDETKHKEPKKDEKKIPVHLNDNDIENLNKIKEILKIDDEVEEDENEKDVKENSEEQSIGTKNEGSDKLESNEKSIDKKNLEKENSDKDEMYLITGDIDWLYIHLQQQRKTMVDGDKNVPYLHVLLEGSEIQTPENRIIKRDPILEARCVKLRAQQEARDYRKMTKSVDNVRMRFPEDSISYQLKQMNRQLIAIGQFIISIFAGFLFGFRGVEWMVGNLDFGFRLLLGVMCALVIALAEIYFLAKKLNEELNIPETTQLGGPPKFADQPTPHYDYVPKVSSKPIDKEHQD